VQFAQSDRQRQIAQDFGQLFTDDLAPALRRAAPRPIGADPDPDVRRQVWQAMQDLGAVRMALPESCGGDEAGLAETTVVAALTGGALFPSPLPGTLLAADLLRRVAPQEVVDRLANGATVAVAARDRGNQSFTTPTPLSPEHLGPRADPQSRADSDTRTDSDTQADARADSDTQADPQSRADSDTQADPQSRADSDTQADSDTRANSDTRAGDRAMVRRFVPFAAEVDELLLVATTPDGLVCALVPRDDPSVSLVRNEDIAWGELYTVTFDRTPANWIDVPQQAWAAAVAAARIRHAAYLTGMAQAALDLTVTYARERRQFGQPIGRFQSLAFRLAAAATDVEAAKLLVDHAAWLADTGADPTMASLETLANAGDLALKVAAEAVQIHGAVGMTDDCDAQLFYRRAAVDAVFLGSPSQHRREAAPFLATHPAAIPDCLDRAL
jgi:alkylation response protein AidB-like acyl-CoA dehydrogenase